MKKKQSYTVIIGCGRVGSGLAGRLSEEGNDVVVVDSDKGAFRKLPASYGGLTIVANASDIQKVIEEEKRNVDTLIAVTDNDNANICAAQMGKKMFHIPRVVARINDDQKAVLLKSMDVDTICPSALSEKEIAHFIDWEDEDYDHETR